MCYRRRSSKQQVRILNPTGTTTHTTLGAARRMIAAGRADWGKGGILLIPAVTLRQMAEQAREREVEAGIERFRGGTVWWNGKDRHPGAQHRPGEVVS